MFIEWSLTTFSTTWGNGESDLRVQNALGDGRQGSSSDTFVLPSRCVLDLAWRSLSSSQLFSFCWSQNMRTVWLHRTQVLRSYLQHLRCIDEIVASSWCRLGTELGILKLLKPTSRKRSKVSNPDPHSWTFVCFRAHWMLQVAVGHVWVR